MTSSLSSLLLLVVLLVGVDAVDVPPRSSLPAFTAGASRAGVGKAPIVLPMPGPSLAGYNYPPRRAAWWPLPATNGTRYTNLMNSNEGVWAENGIYVRALALAGADASPSSTVLMVSTDTIGAEPGLNREAWWRALERAGSTSAFPVAFERCQFSAAHTHSGPAALGTDQLWAVAPAVDLLVPEVRSMVADAMATAMLDAVRSMSDAVVAIGVGSLPGVTHNRRKQENYTFVDTALGIVAVDALDSVSGVRRPLATLWNFAIHGICYDAPNMRYTADVMGAVNEYVEARQHRASSSEQQPLSLFVNADAGDVNPIFSVACQHGPLWSGGAVIGAKVLELRAQFLPASSSSSSLGEQRERLSDFAPLSLRAASLNYDLGDTQFNGTLARVLDCKSGGPLDICSICAVIGCDANIHLNEAWVQTRFRTTAIEFTIGDVRSVSVSVPGEALTRLGLQIRADMAALGYANVLLSGYTNGHIGYIATPDQYVLGGYESVLTLWGIGESEIVRAQCRKAAIALGGDRSAGVDVVDATRRPTSPAVVV